MSTWSRPCVILALVLACQLPLSPAFSQAAYTARRNVRIQAGAGYMLLDNDYTDRYNQGLTLYGDVDFNHWVGIEAEARFGGIITPDDIGENSYEAGPRFLYHRRNLTVYAKVLGGYASITDQRFSSDTSSYNMVAAGAGAEYRIRRRLNVRLDFEDQKWPRFQPHTLSPFATTLGLAYVIR